MGRVGFVVAFVFAVGCTQSHMAGPGSVVVTADAGPVVTPPDAGPVVTPPPDAGPIVTPPDAGPADAGPADAGAADAGPADAGSADAGSADAGPADAGPADGGTITFGGPGPWPVANVTYGSADGILELPVVGTSTDEKQNLWVATNSALYLLQPGEKRFRRFDAHDGLHLQNNPVRYCDDSLGGGDRTCPIYGAAGSPGIIEIVGGGNDEVFVGYSGDHNWNDPNDGTWGDPYRHDGKIDRVRLVRKSDGTIDSAAVVRFDLVSGNTPNYWHNRIIERMLFDHFTHKHELYVGAEHGLDKLSPDLWFEPNPHWPYPDQLVWMSDHLHPVSCLDEWCTGDEGQDTQMMGDWRGLALSPEGDLWVGGKWSAGKIFYTALNAEVKPDGTQGNKGWFQRGGDAYRDPLTGRNYSFGFNFCPSGGSIKNFDEKTHTWVRGGCPYAGVPPVFVPPKAGDEVSISAVAVTPDGTSWWASGPLGPYPAYGLAWYDGNQFHYVDPVAQAGTAERSISDMVALPDGRLVLAGPNSGLTLWNPARPAEPAVHIRAGQGIPDDHVTRLELDAMVKPPALHVSTAGGAAVLRVLP